MAARHPSARSAQLKVEKVVITGLAPKSIHAAPVVPAVLAAAVADEDHPVAAAQEAQKAGTVQKAVIVLAQQAEKVAALQPMTLEVQTGNLDQVVAAVVVVPVEVQRVTAQLVQVRQVVQQEAVL